MRPQGPSRYELSQQCAARSYATKRKTEGCPSLANIGHRAGEPAAPWDHTVRYLDNKERPARDDALRKLLEERLAGLQFEAYFTEAGFLGSLTLLDGCVAPAVPPATSNTLAFEDLTLIEGILRDNADVMGLPPFTKLEMVCDYDNYHYPADGPPKRPLSECKVLLSPEPLVDPRIVFRRDGAPSSPEVERCFPVIKLSSMSLPVSADMVPPRTLDVRALVRQFVGKEVTIPGTPSTTNCLPVDPLPGEEAEPLCSQTKGTPAQKITVTPNDVSAGETWYVTWSKTERVFKVSRQIVLSLPSRESFVYWDPVKPPSEEFVTSIYRPSPLEQAVAAP